MEHKTKYRVECGSLVTVFRGRTFTVSADTPEEAAKKAENKFRQTAKKAGWDCDTVSIDNVEQIQE